jgi:hypothetical protein
MEPSWCDHPTLHAFITAALILAGLALAFLPLYLTHALAAVRRILRWLA